MLVTLKKFINKVFSSPLLLSLILVLAAIGHFSAHHVGINDVREINADSQIKAKFSSTTVTKRYQRFHYYQVTLSAFMSTSAEVNIIADDKVIEVVSANAAITPKLAYPKTRTSYRDLVLGDLYRIDVSSGDNIVYVKTLNTGGGYDFKIATRLSLVDYLVALICLLLPTILLASFVLSRLFSANYQYLSALPRWPLAYYLLFIAIALKVSYFIARGYMTFQHDYHGHIEYIKFFAEHFTIPLPHKGWEFPQQPLYYILSGSLYAVMQWFDVSDDTFFWTLDSLTVMLSSIALIYAYRLVKLLSDDTFVHNLTICFLAFTPSLMYMSARISNDPLAASFAIITLFYLIASYQHQFKRFFFTALFCCSALFLSKISTVAIELLFFVLLLMSYKKSPDDIKHKLRYFMAVGLTLLSYSLYNAYYPAAGTFHFVNSGIWPGQDLRPLGVDYFFSFNFSELYQQGQSVIGDKSIKAIAASYPTYQYGTMFFGEFDYEYWRRFSPLMLPLQQAILALGLIIPIAWLSFIFLVKKEKIEWLLAGVFLISFALIIKFVIAYPSMSNTDFRYHTTSFFIIAFFFARGLSQIAAIHPTVKKSVITLATLLFAAEFAFIGLFVII